MATKKKMLMSSAGAAGAGGAGLDVEEVFSTYLYEGTGGALTVNNGIDLSNEGGLVWTKNREDTRNHVLFDTERTNGEDYSLFTNTTDPESENSAFNFVPTSTGYTFNNNDDTNKSGFDFVGWTFRKAPKFFDVVTYTGNGTSQTISHNLSVSPAVIITKRTDAGSNWLVYHTSVPTQNIYLNNTSAAAGTMGITSVSDSSYAVNGSSELNENNGTYVAYIFAHNDGDGEFGPDGDLDIIKCGSYAGNESSFPTIDLGFEPQFILLKSATSAENWHLIDTMRGWFADGTNSSGDYKYLWADAANSEGGGFGVNVTPTGFELTSANAHANSNGNTFIYIAIRRGTKVPESGTEVFNIDVRDDTDAPMYKSGFVTDFSLYRDKVAGDDWRAQSRLTGKGTLFPNTTDSESSAYNTTTWDFMNGFHEAGSINTGYLSWMWKRAPGYFDAVAYTGNGTAGRTVSHNLTVAPEMMWVKCRSTTESWATYHTGVGAGVKLLLNQDWNSSSDTTIWNNTTPSETDLTLGTSLLSNGNGRTYIAYLFASLPGISKVGSFSHTVNTATNVDCGFTSGARFVLVKQYDGSGNWWVWDTERGIVAGNDNRLALNTTSAENTGNDDIDPYSAGFTWAATWSTGNYIFYAIA